MFLSGLEQSFAGLALEHSLASHQNGPLGLADHVHGACYFLVGRLRAGFGSIFVLGIKILKIGWIGEAGSGHFAREIEMHGTGDAGFHVPESVSAIFPHAIGRDEALAVLLHAGGDGLLITGLDERFAIVAGDLHVAGEHEERRAGGVRGGDVHDHVREARAFGAGASRGFTGDPRESIGCGAHGTFGAAAIAGYSGRGHGVDDSVVAGAAEHRGEIFFFAELREYFSAGHATAFESSDLGRFTQGGRDLLRDADCWNGGRGAGE